MTSERGQSTPFFLCFLVLMTVMVGTMVNVGQAINRRIALQIVADAGAWTGATNMAIGLNGLAEVNKWRRSWNPILTIGLPAAGPFGFETVPKGLWSALTIFANSIDAGIQVGYGKKPYDEAARVTMYNSQDLFPGEQLEWYEGYRPWGNPDAVSDEMPFAKSRPTLCLDQPFLTSTLAALPCLVDLEPIENTVWYTVPGPCPWTLFQCPKTFTYVKWFEKEGGPISFVWVVKAPEAAPLFNPFGVFGDDAIPEMVAAAHAKPAGGSIEEGSATYRVRMEPLSAAAMYLAPVAAFRSSNYDPIFEKWRRVFY